MGVKLIMGGIGGLLSFLLAMICLLVMILTIGNGVRNFIVDLKDVITSRQKNISAGKSDYSEKKNESLENNDIKNNIK